MMTDTINPIHNDNLLIEIISKPIEIKNRNNLKDVKDQDNVEFTIIVLGAAFFSFNSGFINCICILAHNQGVTHVTGSLTYFGISVANNDAFMSLNYLCIICCYMFGSSITGYFTTEVTPLKLGLEYGPLFIIGSILLLIACVFEYSFDDNQSSKSYLYIFFCAMASGLQNGITTKYSNNVLRTTHMTGTATDIGIVLGQIVAAKYDEIWRLYMLLPSYIAFFIGGIFGVGIFKVMGRYSLTISCIIFFTIGVCYSYGVRKYINDKSSIIKY